MSPLFRPIVFCTLMLPLAAHVGAETILAEGYALRIWQTEDGLPQNTVTCGVQTQDGYLWFATYGGLARFNGDRFSVFEPANTPAMQDRRVAQLFEDQSGTLWIGHEAGGITRYREGRFETAVAAQGADGNRIMGLGSDEQGQLWAMHESGSVDSLTNGDQLASLIAPARPGVMAWSRGTQGSIWLVENGTAARLANGSLTPIALPPPQVSNYVFGIAASARGGAWILCDDRIRRWEDGHWAEDRGPVPWKPGSLSSCLELRDGTLAVGTIQSGLFLIFPGGRTPVRFDQDNGLPQNWIRFLCEDREGNLWAGAGSAALVSIHPTAFSVLDAPDHFRGCSILATAPGQDGSLWIGTDGAGLYHYGASGWTRFGDESGLTNPYIPAVAQTSTGEVWAGYYWWGSPFRLQDGRFVRPDSVDESTSPVLALVPRPDSDALLVGTRDGLLQVTPARSTWLIKSPEGTTDDVCAVTVDRHGIIWCGFAQGGLARLDGETLTFFRQPHGLGSDSVQCLWADEDDSLWIGTADHGLTRFKDGRFVTLGLAQGLADTVVCAILADDFGYVWMSTHHGIQRVARADLRRCADGAIAAFSSQVYDRSDGLPIVEFLGGRQAAACKTPDGRLWFASSKGVVRVDPALIAPNPLPPPVVFEGLLVDGKVHPGDGTSEPDPLPPDHQRLEFRFAGLSYVAPSKVRFKYRLDGLDKSWVDAGTLRAASYSHLTSGTYRFRVIACNNDGVWNPAGAAVSFTVAPYFWETWWFIGGCALAAISAVAIASRTVTRRRMQRRMEQLQRRHALELERARIARDIHDDVGASLTRISMLSQPTQLDLAEHQRTVTLLSRIYATAKDMTQALDEIVWAVDPRHDTLDSLVSYMGKYAQDFLSAAHIRCRLDLPFELPVWPITAEIRHNLFLAFKEALNNVHKHAQATEVRIALRLRPDAFQLEVRDNGRGFPEGDPDRSASPHRTHGGNGLDNMRKRLATIGGRCEITTAPGAGVTLSLVLHRFAPGGPPPAFSTT